MITDTDLIDEFVPQHMATYFQRKCPHLDDEAIRSQLCEMLKFLILVEHFPGNIVFGKEIDDLWHLWIMQTRQYEELCRKLPGGVFRHHSSKDYPEEVPEMDMVSTGAVADLTQISQSQDNHTIDRLAFTHKAERIISFFVTYRHNFGRISEAVIAYWPPLDRLVERLGWNAETLNAFLELQIEQAKHGASVAAQ